jgi:hypothetical protein
MPTVKPETILDIGIDGECPICAAHKLAKNTPFNDTIKAAIAEGEAIFKGELPAKWYRSLDEARKDLGV